MRDLAGRIAALSPKQRELLALRLGKQENRGEPGPVLRAFFVAAGATPPDQESIREHLLRHLPDYMVPANLVALDELPLLANGKLDVRALRQKASGTGEPTAQKTPPGTVTERVLAGIWRDLLRIGEPGIHDNFFSLGGDSILSIQLVSRARREGLNLETKQIFEHPTIAGLAAVAGSAVPTMAEQGPITGELPLTPIQHDFFAHNLAEPNHYNQALLLEVPPEVDPRILSQAISLLGNHHDALRFRFSKRNGVWVQESAPPGQGPVLEIHNRSVDEDSLKREAAGIQKSLNIANGPVFRAVLFPGEPGSVSRLFMVAHHLVIDGVSWRILIEDLESACLQLRRGQGPVALPPKTTSFKEWSQGLDRYANSVALRDEYRYWSGKKPGFGLPVDFPAGSGENTVAGTGQVRVGLNRRETGALLAEVHGAYNTRINDFLLAALAKTLSQWTGEPTVSVDLEGHGREPLFPEVDLSRTVGWFTTLYPVRLTLPQNGEPGDLLKSVKEQLRRIPQNGIGFGLLKYMNRELGEDRANRTVSFSGSEILFNYLGQVDQTFANEDGFRPASGSTGPVQAAENRRTHVLELNAMVAEGSFSMAWTYGRSIHREETVRGLAESFIQNLGALIDHCRQPGAGGPTPSDFPLANIDQSQLDRLTARHARFEDLYPLSPMQEGMLFHALLDADSRAYFEQMSCVLSGGFDERAFRGAWAHVIGRHPILRTAFLWEDLAAPLQVVFAKADLPWQSLDWSDSAPELRDRKFSEFLAEDRAMGFDLTRPPLIRLSLIRFATQQRWLVWSMHHLLADGWSAPVLIGEVFEAYHALSKGLEPGSPPVPHFRTYIEWLQRQDTGKAESYWRETLRGYDTPFSFRPFAAAAPESPNRQPMYRTLRRHCSETATQALKKLAGRHGLTLATLVQGAWALLLSRYGGGDDTVFGVTVSGRPGDLPGSGTMIGLFINTLPARVRIPVNEPLLPWLGGIQAEQARREHYAYASLTSIQGWSQVPRPQPLFESILVFENYPADAGMGSARQKDDGLSIGDISTFEHATYPLTLAVGPGRQLQLAFDFDAANLDERAMARMLRHLQNLLAAMAQNFSGSLADLDPLDEEERQHLLASWNGPEVALDPEPLAVQRFFETQARRRPDSVALSFEPSTANHSYRCLDLVSSAWSRALRDRGIGPESTVALCLEPSPEMVIAIMSVLKAGGAYLPLNPENPPARTVFALEDSGAEAVLTQSGFAGSFRDFEGKVFCMDRTPAPSPASANGQEKTIPANLDSDHPAYLIYTSGSTGEPKGVAVSHRSIYNRIRWASRVFGMTPACRFLQLAAYHFDISIWETVAPLAEGGCLLLPDRARRIEPAYLAGIIASRHITDVHFVPSLLGSYLRDRDLLGTASLQRVYCGGELLKPELLQEFGDKSRAALHHFYGPTEAAINITSEPCRDPRPGTAVPLGKPIDNTELYLLDTSLRLVPPGVTGELFIGGASLARGYRGRPDLTAEVFLPNPFAKGARIGSRLYKTGDRARHSHKDTLAFVGRVDHQIKLRGYRIEPGEIEKALAAHPGIQEGVVLLSDPGSDRERLVAYLVPVQCGGDRPHEPDADALRAFLAERLPEPMVPSTFVNLERLPLNANGKLDRKALPAPQQAIPCAKTRQAPRNLVELRLKNIWEESLGLHPIGLTDNFFELGGHSLTAVRLMSKIGSELGVKLPLTALFQNPTIEAIGRLLHRDDPEKGRTPLVSIQPKGELRPFFCVHPAGGDVLCYADLARHLGQDRPFYGLRSPTLDGGEPFETIEAMAEAYLDAVRQAQARGPYLLGGWSLGGVVAFEMACILKAAGEEVAALVMFDATLVGTAIRPRMGDSADRLVRLVRELSADRDTSLELDPAALRNLSPDAQVDAALARVRALELPTGELDPEAWRLVWRTFEANANAAARYRPRPFPGRLTLFVPKADPGKPIDDLADDWKTLAEGGVAVHQVEGTHESMVYDPAAETLAERLRLLFETA